MAITQSASNSYKQEALRGQHQFGTTGFTTTGSSSSSTSYTSVGSMTNIVLGQSFTGTNVGASSIVTAITGTAAFTSSVAASGSIAGGTLTFTNPMATSYKLALFTSAVTLDATTATYSATNEASGTGYSAGGSALTISASMPGLTSGVGYIDFADLVFSTATVTARGCQIYNSYAGLNRSIAVYDFGADKSSSAGDFTIIFPTPDNTSAILRLA